MLQKTVILVIPSVTVLYLLMIESYKGNPLIEVISASFMVLFRCAWRAELTRHSHLALAAAVARRILFSHRFNMQAALDVVLAMLERDHARCRFLHGT